MSTRKSKVPTESGAQTQAEPFLPLAPSRLADVKASLPAKPPAKALPEGGDFVRGSKWTPIRQTGAYEGSCWIFGPARILFLAEATDAFVTVAELMDLPDEKFEKMDVVLQKSTKQLFFRPAPEGLEEYFDATETAQGYLTLNIRSLLQENGLEVRSGYQERYPVTLEVDSPIGPALVVDLTKMEERRQTSDEKARKAAKAAAKAEGGTATKKTGKGSKANSSGKPKLSAKGKAPTADSQSSVAPTAEAQQASPAPSKGKAKAAPPPDLDDEVDEEFVDEFEDDMDEAVNEDE